MLQVVDTQGMIAKVCDEIKAMLLEKNRKYGNAALNPTRVFARSDALEQINVRIDDKLNRIKNRQNDEDEDVEKDLLGYLVLKQVWHRLHGENAQVEYKPNEFATSIQVNPVSQGRDGTLTSGTESWGPSGTLNRGEG